MAAVAEMGEVDEMHSKEEVAAVNGDLNNDVDMEEKEEETIKKNVTKSVDEIMDVDEEDKNDNKSVDKDDQSEKEIVNSSDEQQNGKDENVEEKNEEMEVNDDVDEKEESSQDGSTVEKDNDKHDDGESTKDDVEAVSISEDNKSIEEGDEDEEEEVDENNSKKDENKSIDSGKENKDDKKDEDEVHEIDDDDDEDDVVEKPQEDHETIELNDSGGEDDGDCIVVESSEPTENGTTNKKDAVINLATPEKKNKNEGKTEAVTPRRSTRNLNKTQTYVDSEKEEITASEESDIEEVLPQDPLAVSDSVTLEKIDKTKKDKPSTIVVKDTKRLVEIASKTNNSTSSKKEPTLVIIDTNSILSGRGPVPVNKPAISTSSYSPSVLPVAVPAQGMYPPNMRATITPIPVSNASKNQTNNNANQPPLLPTLTDDMFVVEAPSFIVPYVYEKPPKKDLKEFVKDMKEQLIKERKEKEKKEKAKNKSEKKDSSSNEEQKDNEKGKEKEKEEGDKKKDSDDDDESFKDLDESSSSDDIEEVKKDDEDKPYSYFQSPLGKFFIDIGVNLVQEFVQNDLLKQQKRKRDREQGSNPETNKAIHSILKNLEFSKENNEPFKMTIKKCEFCNFKTESSLAMSYHLETPHMKNFVYRCNFCTYEVRSPHDILFHMEAEHAVRAHLERAPAFHQCPNCQFEDNQKGKVSRHLVACMRKFKPERNLEPPIDWEPPAKIPRVPKMRQQGLNATATAYQAMAKSQQYQLVQKMQMQNAQQTLQRGRGRPTLGPQIKTPPILRPSGMMYKQQTMSGGSVLVPTNYQLSGNQVFQVVGGQELSGRLGNTGQMSFVPNIPSASNFNIQNQNQNKKPVHQPSISITPLPRGSSTTSTPAAAASAKPGDSNSKNSFVICEICDGYIKDLEQLRNHMQWIHKIKIHPKMIYNRPPLNCQKCQFRFFTDQGLERHLLGSHGLVTSSMQDAANKSKDSGRCPVCGRVYQWKLLNHVARDHNMTLKPAHLSYKCTVCTATFGMYKQFENHVYSAHSVVAKRVMDKKNSKSSNNSSSGGSSNADLKPLKINDEITIIPQPPRSSTTNGAAKEGSPSSSTGSNHSRTSTPGTSKNADSATTTPSTSRAERLARRNASGGDNK